MAFERGDVDMVSARLAQRGLIPPVRSITATGERDGEDILIVNVQAELTPDLSARIPDAFGDLPHELRAIPTDGGIFYEGDTDIQR